MEELYELKDIYMRGIKEFETVKEGRIKMGEVEAINLVTDTIKNIDKICMPEGDDGYSQAGEWEAEMRGNYGHGNSYRIRRDARGRYSRDGMRDGRNGGGMYSRGADGRECMIDEMERLMDNADSEKEREAIRRCISQLEKA